MTIDPAQAALSAVNQISAMIAYWDANQRCVFSNNAYREWFGRTPQEMIGMSMQELLGPLYPLNLPYIKAALHGNKQVFERRIPLPGGGAKDTIATYTPDVVNGEVRGFWAHVADVTSILEREAILERTIRERDAALAEVHTLRGLLPICSNCKDIKDENGKWNSIETYVSERSDARFTHGMCPTCFAKLYPSVKFGGPLT